MTKISQDVLFNRISKALLVDYTSIYYVDALTNEYYWYSMDQDYHSLQLEPSGHDFFENLSKDVLKVVYKDDQHIFTEDFTKEKFLHDIKKGNMTSLKYRLMLDGRPVWHRLRMIKDFTDGENYYILGVQNIDEEVRRNEESKVFSEIATNLARRYNTIYYIDLISNDYYEFTSTDLYKVFDENAAGHDFFKEAEVNAKQLLHPDDIKHFMFYIEKETLISNLSSEMPEPFEYRMVIGGKEIYMRLTGMINSEGTHIILCVENIDTEKRALVTANKEARIDSLTGLLNKRAYYEYIDSIKIHIQSGFAYPFALVMCDVNNLKEYNDTYGHIEGDNLIKKAAGIIKKAFPGSPAYRMGGDEFIVILLNKNYENRYLLFMDFRKTVRHNAVNGTVPVIASGMSDYEPTIDKSVQEVAHRADLLMYENKGNLRKLREKAPRK